VHARGAGGGRSRAPVAAGGEGGPSRPGEALRLEPVVGRGLRLEVLSPREEGAGQVVRVVDGHGAREVVHQVAHEPHALGAQEPIAIGAGLRATVEVERLF